MRHVTAILSVAAVVLMAAGLAAQAKPNFAGDWMMVGPDGRGNPGATLTITQSAGAITLADTGGGQAPTPGTLTYKLDGSDSRNTVAGRGGGAPTEQVSKAMWAGNKIVVTTATGSGEERRTFSMDDADLVIETTAPSRYGGPPRVTKVTGESASLLWRRGARTAVARPIAHSWTFAAAAAFESEGGASACAGSLAEPTD